MTADEARTGDVEALAASLRLAARYDDSGDSWEALSDHRRAPYRRMAQAAIDHLGRPSTETARRPAPDAAPFPVSVIQPRRSTMSDTDTPDADTGNAAALRAAVEALLAEWQGTRYSLPPGYPMTVDQFCRQWFIEPLRKTLVAAPAPTEDRTGRLARHDGDMDDEPAPPEDRPHTVTAAVRGVLDAEQAWTGNPDESGPLTRAIQRLRDAYVEGGGER